jgi:hypothetical protein
LIELNYPEEHPMPALEMDKEKERTNPSRSKMMKSLEQRSAYLPIIPGTFMFKLHQGSKVLISVYEVLNLFNNLEAISPDIRSRYERQVKKYEIQIKKIDVLGNNLTYFFLNICLYVPVLLSFILFISFYYNYFNSYSILPILLEFFGFVIAAYILTGVFLLLPAWFISLFSRQLANRYGAIYLISINIILFTTLILLLQKSEIVISYNFYNSIHFINFIIFIIISLFLNLAILVNLYSYIIERYFRKTKYPVAVIVDDLIKIISSLESNINER